MQTITATLKERALIALEEQRQLEAEMEAKREAAHRKNQQGTLQYKIGSIFDIAEGIVYRDTMSEMTAEVDGLTFVLTTPDQPFASGISVLVKCFHCEDETARAPFTSLAELGAALESSSTHVCAHCETVAQDM